MDYVSREPGKIWLVIPFSIGLVIYWIQLVVGLVGAGQCLIHLGLLFSWCGIYYANLAGSWSLAFGQAFLVFL